MPEIAVERARARARSKRRRRLVLSLAVVAVGMLWGGWKWREVGLYRKAIAEVEEDIDKGRTSPRGGPGRDPGPEARLG